MSSPEMPARVFICIQIHILVPQLGDHLTLVRRREPEQLSKPRFVRFARRTITVGLNPFGMLDAQGVMYLSLKLSVRADLVCHLRNSFRFHHPELRQ
jgi:hypothetical protein